MIIRENTVWAVPDWMPEWMPPKVGRLALTGLTCSSVKRRFWMDALAYEGGTGFKLFGLSYLPATFHRLRYGWDEVWNYSHENSDRFVCTVLPDGRIRVSRYAYRNGWGGISSMEEKLQFRREYGFSLSAHIATISSREEVQMGISVHEGYAEYRVGNVTERVPFLDEPRCPFLLESAHADNGSRQPVAPHDIRFRLR